MHRLAGLFAVAAIFVIASWWWRGLPVEMPPDPLPVGEKLYCVSYAPFRGWQTPLDPTTHIPAAQIEEDLASLARITDCVRIYSVDLGLDKVPEIAERHGLKVLLGIWISSETRRNHEQIRIGVGLANRFAATVRAVIVGNEVMLRGEITEADLGSYIKAVRQQVRVPVTYADVWEFWLRHRALETSVDFITVHILPYWEDEPIPAVEAARHTVSIRARVAQSFPGKDVIIGEAGWPSAGRMREGALPSPSEQARVLHDLVAASRLHGFKVNLIEAFDQPWKRHLEGTVGGHWGLISDAPRRVKFAWGQPVSDRPFWKLQAASGVVFAALVFGVAWIVARRRTTGRLSDRDGIAVAAVAAAGGAFLGGAVESALLESLGAGGWLRSAMLVALAAVAPLSTAAAIAARIELPPIDRLIGPVARRVRDPIAVASGVVLILTCVMAAESALGLTFNPRYLDFPWNALTAAVAPLLVLSFWHPAGHGKHPAAETAFAVVLAVCAVKIIAVETLANWQSLWLAIVLLAHSLTLARVRAAPGSEE